MEELEVQHAVLTISLGATRQNITIKDIQLWRVKLGDEPMQIGQLRGRFVCYVSLDRLPLWVWDAPRIMRCYSTSNNTKAYFQTRLRRPNRGIVVEYTERSADSNNSHDKFLLIYRDRETVHCSHLNVSCKREIDKTVALGEAEPKAVLDRKIHFNDTVSKLILTGLRLRDIPNTAPGFAKLYRMTFQATEFAHRDAKKAQYQVPFEALQHTVETLLQLFTKS